MKINKQEILSKYSDEEQKLFEPLLDMLITTIDEYNLLKSIVDSEGFTYKAGPLTKPNPAVTQMREAQKTIFTLSTRFGLSPRDKKLISEVNIKTETKPELTEEEQENILYEKECIKFQEILNV